MKRVIEAVVQTTDAWRTTGARLALILMLAVPAGVKASIDTYEFQDEGQLRQYQILAQELRCPKCQNQNIADSNAPIAQDMREQVYRLTLEGKSQTEIVDYMIERFGEFVTYTPRFDLTTWLLWLGPGFLALLGLVVVVRMARPKSVSQAPVISQEERDRLKSILTQDEKPS